MAAKMVGVSRRAAYQASALERDAPDLAEQVRTGQLKLGAADKLRREHLRALPNPEAFPLAGGPREAGRRGPVRYPAGGCRVSDPPAILR
jgi:hypothetical protein